jgi:DNA-binding MarR family transcriptional regulator
MSRQDKLDILAIDNVLPESLVDDDRLQLDLRLRLEDVAAAEEERLRLQPRRRPTRAQLARLAYHLYKARRDRTRMFDEELFGEPAWDMLLALYCLPRRGEILTVSSLSNAASVPGTTGLRWQKTLLEEGLIQRGPHIRDRRQALISLTHRGRLLMDEYLSRLFLCHGGVPDLD